MRSSLYFLKVHSSEEWRELEAFPARWGVPHHREIAREFFPLSFFLNQKRWLLANSHHDIDLSLLHPGAWRYPLRGVIL